MRPQTKQNPHHVVPFRHDVAPSQELTLSPFWINWNAWVYAKICSGQCVPWRHIGVTLPSLSSLFTPCCGVATSEWRNKETLPLPVAVERVREWTSPSTQIPLSKDENCLLSTWGRGPAVRHWIYKAFTFISFKPHHKPVRETGAGEMLFTEHKSWARYSARTWHTA